MKSSSRLLAILAFVTVVPASALALGCSGATEQPHTSASALAKAPVGETTHGPVRLVGAALGEVPLRPDQRAKLETVLKDADARHAGGLAARKDLMTAFADQVERGQIDRAALAPKIEAARGEAQRLRPEDLAALDQVHAILDKEQRAAFVDALEDEIKDAFRGRHGKGHGRGKAKDGEGHPRKGHDGHDGAEGPGFWRMKQLAEELKLTDTQKDEIKTKLKALKEKHAKDGGEHGPREHFARMRQAKQALERFKDDDFKAASLGGLAPAADGQRAERMFDMAEAVVPVLTPEQRKVAADRLRAFAAKGEAH